MLERKSQPNLNVNNPGECKWISNSRNQKLWETFYLNPDIKAMLVASRQWSRGFEF